MQKPFDVNSIMDNLDETLLKEPHDATRTGPGPRIVPEWLNSDGNLGSAPSRPENITAPVPKAPSPEAITEDAINPSHYRKHPSGIECIEVTRHMNFNVGNGIKYLWRYLDKGDPIENLKKAQWYIDDEIRRLQGLR